MTPVTSITPKTVNHLAVERLEDLLARAKSGEIEGMACATVNSDGSIAGVYAIPSNIFTLIGSLRSVERDILDNEVE